LKVDLGNGNPVSRVVCWGFPLGASAKCILLLTILNDPWKRLADTPFACDVAELPTNPLVTSTKL